MRINDTTVRFLVSSLYKKNLVDTRYVVNQGGARSSKTYSIIQVLLTKARQEEKREVYSIVRKTMPSLSGSAVRDFFDVISAEGLYHEENHDKTDNTYQFFNVLFEFFGLDQPQKVRGRKRKILWMNEANEFTSEDHFQLSVRTGTQIYMDFNPSDEFHWIYDEILTRKDCTFIQSTVLDNPFLEQSLRAEILRLKDIPGAENKWRVYGLGERGHKEAVIHTNWDLCDELPAECEDTLYGLDFGFNNPCALVEIRLKEDEAWIDETLYTTRLTNSDLCTRMNSLISSTSHPEIIADCAEPKSIEDLSRYERTNGGRFNVFPAEKGKDSVKHGIDVVNQFKLHVTKRSVNIIKELKSYSWKQDKDGKVLDEPVKYNDHAMNALRYALQHRARVAKFQLLFSA